MKRLVGIGRSRTGRLGLVAGIVVAALGGLSAPAYAHHAIVSGSTVCANNDHVITWSIGNSESNMAMTIDSISATANGQSYAVTGYTSPVGNGGSTTATSVVPGPVTNTSIVLTVHASWPDHATYTATASVPLQGTCGCTCTTTTYPSTTTAPTTTTEPTTTTTEPVTTTTEHHCECNTTTTEPVTTTTVHHCGCSTTTTEATTTTTEPVTTTTEATTTTTEPTTTSTQAEGTTTIVTTTTLGHQGSTVPTTQPPTTQPPTTTTAPPAGELPFTGSGMAFPVIFGLGSLILGGVFAFRKRNAWTR